MPSVLPPISRYNHPLHDLHQAPKSEILFCQLQKPFIPRHHHFEQPLEQLSSRGVLLPVQFLLQKFLRLLNVLIQIAGR